MNVVDDTNNLNPEELEIIDINNCEIIDMNYEEINDCTNEISDNKINGQCPFRNHFKKIALIGSVLIFIIAICRFLNSNSSNFKNTYSIFKKKFRL